MLSAIEYKEKGNRQFKSGQLNAALVSYDKGIELNPGIPELWYNKAIALSRLERFTDAVECFKQALILKPDYTKAQDGLTTAEAKLSEASAGAGTALVFAEAPITVLDLPKPKKVFYQGKELPLSEVEAILGKNFTSSLKINPKLFDDYLKYSHREMFLSHLTQGTKLHKPLDPSCFDIVDLKDCGHALAARMPIPAGTVLGYYCGEIVPHVLGAESPYSLNIHNSDMSCRYRVDLSTTWSLMSLLMHLPTSDFLAEEYAGMGDPTKVCTANVEWAAVNLFEPGTSQGASIIVMFAAQDINPGDYLGFDYSPSYWLARGLTPVLFDTSHSAIPGARLTGRTGVVADDICDGKALVEQYSQSLNQMSSEILKEMKCSKRDSVNLALQTITKQCERAKATAKSLEK